MPPHHPLQGKIIKQGERRGTYEVPVACGSLSTNLPQTAEFHVDGWKWLLALTLVVVAGRPFGVGVCLYSGVADFVNADIELAVSVEGTECFREKKLGKVSCPFGVISKDRLLSYKFGNSLEQLKLNGMFNVTVEVKNIKFATESQHQSCGKTMLPVSVEIMDEESIRRYLNNKNAFGIAPTDGLRFERVCSGSSTNLWANRDPKFRYWIVKRGKDGSVILTRCLNNSSILEEFKDICDERDDSGSKITLFREERQNDNVPFLDVDDDTVIIFVKLYQPDCYRDDLTYVGHVQAKKTATVLELLLDIVEKLSNLNPEAFDAYLEEPGLCVRDITLEESTLKNCSMVSGSMIILREKKPQDREVDLDGFQTALRRIHDDGEPNQTKHGEIIRNFPIPNVEECTGDKPVPSYSADGDITPRSIVLPEHNAEILAIPLRRTKSWCF